MKYILAVSLDVWEISCMIVFFMIMDTNFFFKKGGA